MFWKCSAYLLWVFLSLGCTPKQPPEARESLALQTPALAKGQWHGYVQGINTSERRSPARDSILKQRAALNRISAREVQNPKQPETRLALLKFESVAWAYSQGATPNAYVDLGRAQGLKFIGAIESRLAAKRPLLANVALPQNQSYISIVGSFPYHARKAGFLSDARLTERTRCMLQALFIANWTDPLKKRLAVDDYLHPLERYCLLRWRVEANQAGRTNSRVAAARELNRTGTYPGDYNAAVLLWKAGKNEAALTLLGSSKDPAAKKLRRRLTAQRNGR